MANSHATQAKNSLLKKLPAAYAQGLCASVRKFFAACQENIYSTVRNILCVQSETFCMYSQKHSACTVRNIPAVPAEKSPQIARISRFATIFALLFCVCGVTRAWGQTIYTYTWTGNGGDNRWDNPANWSNGIPQGFYSKLEFNDSVTVIFPYNNFPSWGMEFEIKSGETVTINSSTGSSVINFTDLSLNYGVKISGGTLNLNNVNVSSGIPIEVENGATLETNGTINVGTLTNKGTLTLNTGSSLSVGNNWTNDGTVNVNGNVNATFPSDSSKVSENGKWVYNNTPDIIAGIDYNDIEINGIASTTNDLNIKGTFIVKSGDTYNMGSRSITAKKIIVEQYGILDAGTGNITADEIENNGTIKLEGTQTVTKQGGGIPKITNDTGGSTVEFYGTGTGSGSVNISKIGTSFGTLKCDMSAVTNIKNLSFDGVTFINKLDIKGNATSKLGITANTQTIITLGTAGVGQNLQINYHNVILQSNQFNVSDGTSVATNQTFTNTETVYNNQNGWVFPSPPYTSDIYFWVGGGGDNNWGTPGNWKYDSIIGLPSIDWPGAKPNAEVHITTAGTVTLNATPLYQIASMEIANGVTVEIAADITSSSITNNGTVNFTGATPTINITSGTNNGTVTINGNPSGNVGVTNSANSTVNYTISATGVSQADVNFGTTYGNLVCEPNAGGKTLNFDQDIIVNGNLTLNGTNGNLLSINGNNTNITLARANQSGSYLKINYANVSINSTGFTPYYSVGKTSTDGSGAMPMGNMRGWLFEVQDDYYWYGPTAGNSDWDNPANWRFSDSQSSPAPTFPFYPGNASSNPPTTGAKVHITPTAANTVTLNTTASVYSIEMNNNATLAIGANNLTVQNTWTNYGTVTVTSGNATLPAGTTDNGTWTYTVLRRGLVPITYNVLNLHGGTTGTIITPTATVTANSVNINADTILALGANSLAVRGVASNSWTNSGTVTVTSGNATFATPATDSGTWTYTSSRTGLIRNITYKDVDIGDGTNSINVVLNSGLDSTGTLEIKNGCQLDLVNHSVSANNINNNGTVRLYGTQSVTGANNTGKPTFTGGNSGNVEFYGNTGTTPIDVSMMGTSYDNLTASGYNKTLEFTGTTTVAGDLILKGVNDNTPLTIASSGGTATINVAKAQGNTTTARGIYLAIDRAKVEIRDMQIDAVHGIPYYYWADNSYDTENTLPDTLAAVRGGWRIPTIELTNMQLSVAPLGGNTVYVRAVQNTMDNLAKVSPRILSRLPLFFNVADTGATQMATVSSANLIYNGGKVAWIRLVLSGLGNITVDNLKNYYVGTYTTDPNNGNMTREYHPLSDFAVGAVNPLFAYDNRYADSDANWQTSAFSSGVAVRNWDAGQGNDGSLLSKKDIVMSARLAGGSGNDMGNPVLYLSNNPTSGSQSSKYNGDTNSSWRVWLPDVTGLAALSGNANTNTIDSMTGNVNVSGSGTNPIFNIPAGSDGSYGNWKDGDQITFMFGVTDTANVPINVGGATIGGQTVQSHPLYALRLREPGDITSLDLWSVRLRGMTAHRGGVSIRNNVINVTTGEQVTIEVDMPTTGTLNVMVMTLDGSIVKYLQHGTASAGKHAYHWDGRNNAGSPVARGLYFIRVVGSGIDETRKVMAIKE